MRRRSFIGRGSALLASAWIPQIASATAASYRESGDEFTLATGGISATWTTERGAFRIVALEDMVSRRAIPIPRALFALTFADGTSRTSDQLTIVSGPTVARGAGNPVASRLAERLPNSVVTVRLRDPISRALVTWRAIASEGAKYLRQDVTVAADGAPVPLRDLRLIDFPHLPDATVVGSCDGSPIVANDLFLAIEHPLAATDAIYDRASGSLRSKLDVQMGVPFRASSVIGATAKGQLRRDFLAYVERERAHPYRTFLHYNSWYDIGYFDRYDQAQCLSRIASFGEELHVKRGVTLKSFLFDDGWDDPNDLWAFNSGFPNGFAPLKDAAARYGAKPGAWLSPWGGYGNVRDRRLGAAKRAGYAVNDDGLALSGPKYYELFHSVVMRFIERGGVNQFKIDGTGNSASVVPGSHFGSDFEAASSLIADMRVAEPDIYINLTTGTYPSPIWLQYCDSIWRGGEDHDFDGVGSYRQRWMTYRDGDTYRGVVSAGPLYPLNSLMLHGLIFAQKALHLSDDSHDDFRSEIRSYFGTGTQLQEMYVTPSLLSNRNWDDIAESATWSARNAEVLRDTHWVGGNPSRLDAYGWASWTPRKGILVLRNPRDRAQTLPLDIAEAFELPEAAPHAFVARSALSTQKVDPIRLRAGSEHPFKLEPFEVLVLEATPERATRA